MMIKFANKNGQNLLLLSFLVISLIVLLIIIQSLTYFSSNADRATILQMEENQQNWYQPHQIWTNSTSGDSLLLKELKNDYTQFWGEKYKSEKFKDAHFIEYFIDSKNLKSLKPFYNDEDSNSDFYEENYLVEHQPNITYFSKDGHLAIITDSSMQFLSKLYEKDELIDKKWLKKNVVSTWVLSSGIWKCRQMSLEQSTAVNPFELENTQDRVQKKITLPKTIKGTNYYPQDQAWNQMWTNFKPEIVEKDLILMKKSGLNTIRVFLPFDEFGILKPNISAFDHFDAFLKLCEQHQLQVIPTLFDFYGPYSFENMSLADRQLDAILSRFGNHPQIIAWDLKNEPDLDFKNYGKQTVMDWLEFILIRAKRYAPNQNFTIGWSHPQYASILSNQLNLVSFHYYESPKKFADLYRFVKEQTGDKPIVISEFGQSSYNSFWYPFSKNENGQLAYYQEMFEAFKQSNHQHFMHWTLYDFHEVPTKVVGSLPWRKNIQKHFGFIDKDGNQKAAYSMINGSSTEIKKVRWYQKLNDFDKLFILLLILLIGSVVVIDRKFDFSSKIKNNFKQKFRCE